MSYRLVKSDEGVLKSVVTSTPTELVLLPATTTTRTKEVHTPDCSEKVIAELHKSIQHGVNMLETHGQGNYGDDNDEESTKKLNEDPLDMEAFLCVLLERATRVKCLLKEEGAAQDDYLLACDLFDLCQEFYMGGFQQLGLAGLKTLLCKTADLLHKVRPVDLDLLLQMLQAGKDAGDTMEGKNVLLFIGQTGSGKTSTIHYLAGSTFKEIIVEGFDHLQVVDAPHPGLQNANTSSSTRSVTRSILSIDIPTGSGETVTIADTPGFNDTDGVETDLANGFGLVTAIHRASRVKPVLVLSQKGIGDRFEAVSLVLRTISRLFGKAGSPICLKPFAYLFTKYDEKHKTRLHEQFSSPSSIRKRESRCTICRLGQ
mmetsp:Transcript_26606/g.63799  ORF Transcript_26606/g.63799 Transcript_26606/m.63799 type:complete len:372 (+) Transcript_26606:1239-2354(+)